MLCVVSFSYRPHLESKLFTTYSAFDSIIMLLKRIKFHLISYFNEIDRERERNVLSLIALEVLCGRKTKSKGCSDFYGILGGNVVLVGLVKI